LHIFFLDAFLGVAHQRQKAFSVIHTCSSFKSSGKQKERLPHR
jgi:hypothetical protein